MKKILLLIVIITVNHFLSNAQAPISNDVNCTTCYKTIGTGEFASTLGQYTISTGIASLASGNSSVASGDYSTAFGDNSKSTKKSAFAVGSFAEANGVYSLSLGRKTFANAQSSVAIGKHIDISEQATSSFAIGTFITDSVPFSFVLGTGNANDKRLVNNVSNTLMVGFNSKFPTLFVSASLGSEKTGRIGIGNITVPIGKLHILGDNDPTNVDDASLFIQSSGNYFSTIWLGDTDHSIIAKPGSDITFSTSTGDDFVFNNGDVGIGTDNPISKLDVNGTMRVFNIARFDDKVGIGTSTPSEKLEVNGNILQTTGFNITSSQIKAPDANGLNLTNQSGNGLFVDDAGNVGIGTTSPNYKFEVAGPANIQGSLYQNGQELELGLWNSNNYGINYSGGNLGIGTGSINDAKLIVNDVSAYNNIIAYFKDSEGRKILMVPKLSGFGFNPISNDNDIGIFWSDGLAASGQNLNSDFVIAPHYSQDNIPRGIVITSDGNVAIGTKSPDTDSKLTVAGKIHAREITVTIDAGADYVFDENYDLPTLPDIEDFIGENNHLPDIPSAEQMKDDGLDLGDMQIKLLQKIEELTLYVIELKKENMEIKKEINKLK